MPPTCWDSFTRGKRDFNIPVKSLDYRMGLSSVIPGVNSPHFVNNQLVASYKLENFIQG